MGLNIKNPETHRLAEELGFDAVSFGDHPLLLDCWVWLAAAATTTHRIRVGPGFRWLPGSTICRPDGCESAHGLSSGLIHLIPSVRRQPVLAAREFAPNTYRSWPCPANYQVKATSVIRLQDGCSACALPN